MKKLFKKGFVGFMVIVMIFSLTTPVSAESVSMNEVEAEGLEILKELGYSEEEIEKATENAKAIGEYIEVDENYNFSFDEKTAISNGVDKQLATETKKDIEKTQNLIMKEKEDNELFALCNGTTGYYAPQMMTLLDNCATTSIVTAITGGALLTTIAGMLIGLIPGAAFAGVSIAISGSLIGFGGYLLSTKNLGAGIFILRQDEVYPQPW